MWLNTAVGNKSLSVLLESLETFGYWYVLLLFLCLIFLEGHIIKATFFKDLTYEIQVFLLS